MNEFGTVLPLGTSTALVSTIEQTSQIRTRGTIFCASISLNEKGGISKPTAAIVFTRLLLRTVRPSWWLRGRARATDKVLGQIIRKA